jgi:hypothetical protein
MANVQTLPVCYTRLIWARYRVYKYDRPDSLVQKTFNSANTLLFIPDWTIIATTVFDVISECTGEFSIATNTKEFLSLTPRSAPGVLSPLPKAKRPGIELTV